MNVQRGEVEDPAYDMEFSEEEIETAVYGKNDPENGAAFYRDAVAKADSSDGAEAAEYILDKIRTAKRPMASVTELPEKQKKCSQIWREPITFR